MSFKTVIGRTVYRAPPRTYGYRLTEFGYSGNFVMESDSLDDLIYSAIERILTETNDGMIRIDALAGAIQRLMKDKARQQIGLPPHV